MNRNKTNWLERNKAFSSLKKQFVNMENQPKMEQFLSEIISLMSLALFIDRVIEDIMNHDYAEVQMMSKFLVTSKIQWFAEPICLTSFDQISQLT